MFVGNPSPSQPPFVPLPHVGLSLGLTLQIYIPASFPLSCTLLFSIRSSRKGEKDKLSSIALIWKAHGVPEKTAWGEKKNILRDFFVLPSLGERKSISPPASNQFLSSPLFASTVRYENISGYEATFF